MHVNPDPVVALLYPDTVGGDEIVLHQLEEDCRTNAFSVLGTDSLAGDCLGPRNYWYISSTPVLRLSLFDRFILRCYVVCLRSG